MAEEFALQQLRIERRAMHRDVARLRAVAQGMQGAGDQFLARAALALDQDRRARRRDLAHGVIDGFHDQRAADELLQPLAGAFFDLLAEFAVLDFDILARATPGG